MSSHIIHYVFLNHQITCVYINAKIDLDIFQGYKSCWLIKKQNQFPFEAAICVIGIATICKNYKYSQD